MNDLKLSIILPIYNVEKYLDECLDSLYNQDIPETEYEVICVNDCSPDTCRDIVLARRYYHSNLILIDHEVNKKQGGARNTGLKAAKGKYVWFVDPDDYIEKNVLGKLLKICEINDLDILLFNYSKVTSDKRKLLLTSNYASNTAVYSGIDYIYNVWGGSYFNHYAAGVVWNRICKKKFLKKHNILFPENIKVAEDVICSLRTIIFSKKIMSLSDIYYNYRENADSAMQTMFSYKMDFIFPSAIILGKQIIDLADEVVNIHLPTSIKLKEGGIFRINTFTKPLLKAPFTEKKKFYKMLKENKDLIDAVYPFFNEGNKRIISYPCLSRILLFVINPVVQFLLKLKK